MRRSLSWVRLHVSASAFALDADIGESSSSVFCEDQARSAARSRVPSARVFARSSTLQLLMSKELRFCVGELGDVHSAAWKVWVRKDDIYLHSTGMGSDLKVSIHASGQCQLSGTSAFVLAAGIPNRVRHGAVWQRPPFDSSGRCRVLQVILPRSEMTRRTAKRFARNLALLPLPPLGYATAIDLVLADSPTAASSGLDSQLAALLEIPLLSGGRLLVGWRNALLGSKDLEILHTLHEMSLTAPSSSSTAFAWAHISAPHGYHALIEFIPQLVVAGVA